MFARIKLVDAEGRSCIYVPITQDGKVNQILAVVCPFAYTRGRDIGEAVGAAGVAIEFRAQTGGNTMAKPPIISHEAATAPATKAWNRANHGARDRYRRGRVRILRRFGLEVLLRLTRQRSKPGKTGPTHDVAGRHTSGPEPENPNYFQGYSNAQA